MPAERHMSANGNLSLDTRALESRPSNHGSIMQNAHYPPNRELYMRYSCTEAARIPRMSNSNTLFTMKTVGAFPNHAWVPREAEAEAESRPEVLALASIPVVGALFDRNRRDELGRGGQISGPPEPPRPHDLEIADE